MGPQQDLSSPEDETDGSFHTPRHAPTTIASSMHSVLTSQESIDIFHDAFSTFPPLLPVIHRSPTHKLDPRRRHYSSEAQFEGRTRATTCVPDWLEGGEDGERTCMLPHKGPIDNTLPFRMEPCKGNRSCHCSPSHLPRLALSMISLKRVSPDKFHQSPQRETLDHKDGATLNYVPCAKVAVIREKDEVDPGIPGPLQNGAIPSIPPQGYQTEGLQPNGCATGIKGIVPRDDTERWKEHYVPCTELLPSLSPAFPLGSSEGKNHPRRARFFTAKTGKIRKRRSLIQKIKEEFRLTNFKFEHEHPHLFVTSQWQQPGQMCCMYLAYRLFWGIYFTMWAVWSWVGFGGYTAHPKIKLYYFIYLTNWGIWLLSLDTMLQAINVAFHMRKIALEGVAKYYKMKATFKTSWVLSTLTPSLHIFITMMFWTTVSTTLENPLNAISINTHVVPCIYIFLDLLISATPRRLLHAYLIMGLITVYGIFTDVYYLFGGISHKGKPFLYPLLDWSQPSKTWLVGAGLILLLVPAIHTIVVCLYGLRVKLWHNLDSPRYTGEMVETASISMEERV